MIQRIQSLYLFLVAVGAFILFLMPLAHYNMVADIIVYVNLLKGTYSPVDSSNPFLGWVTWPAFIFDSLMGILALISIFLYKNRTLQVRVAMFGFLSNIILIGLIFFQLDGLKESLQANTVHYNWGTLIPVITLLLFIFANKAIRKDERMIRSAERLR